MAIAEGLLGTFPPGPVLMFFFLNIIVFYTDGSTCSQLIIFLNDSPTVHIGFVGFRVECGLRSDQTKI